MSEAVETRRFSVYGSHVDHHHARILEESSFEAAAVAYVEDIHAFGDEEAEISVFVREIDSGRQHCFRIDLDTGAAAPCD